MQHDAVHLGDLQRPRGLVGVIRGREASLEPRGFVEVVVLRTREDEVLGHQRLRRSPILLAERLHEALDDLDTRGGGHAAMVRRTPPPVKGDGGQGSVTSVADFEYSR